jgi:hypothetical protein
MASAVEERLSVRQEPGPRHPRDALRRIRLEQGLGLLPPHRDAVNCVALNRGEQDRSVGAPRAGVPDTGRHVADRHDDPALEIGPEQLSRGEETDRGAVGRPEGRPRPLRSRHGLQVEGRDGTQPELRAGVLRRRDERQILPVGRKRVGARLDSREELPSGRRSDREADGTGRRRRRARPQKKRHGERGGEPRRGEPRNGGAEAGSRRRSGCGRRRAVAFGKVPQLQRDVVHRLPAIRGGLRKTDADQPLEGRRRQRREPRDRRRLSGQHGDHEGGAAVSAERGTSRRHFVHHGAEGEHVGSRVRRPALQLLGGHVREGPEDRALLGQRPRRRLGDALLSPASVSRIRARPKSRSFVPEVVSITFPGLLDTLLKCASEIAQALDRAHGAGIVHRDGASGRERGARRGSRPPDVPSPGNRARPRGRRRRSRRCSGGKLGDRPRLPLEAFADFGRRSEVRPEDLDRDDPAEAAVPPTVDLPHPARPDAREDFVGARDECRQRAP